MLATIFHKIWYFENKMQKNAKMQFFFEQDLCLKIRKNDIFMHIKQLSRNGRVTLSNKAINKH